MFLPDFARGTADEQARARRLRDQIVTDLWGDTHHLPRPVRLVLLGLTDPRWWITHQHGLTEALAQRLGPHADLLTGGPTAARQPRPDPVPTDREQTTPRQRPVPQREPVPSRQVPASSRPSPIYLLLISYPAGKGKPEGFVVRAESLLMKNLSQPDAALIYRCLPEAPGRRPGEVVPMSTLHYELDNRRLWRKIGDHPDHDLICKVLMELCRRNRIDFIRVAMSDHSAFACELAPTETRRIQYTDGTSENAGPNMRRSLLKGLERELSRLAAETADWDPGGPLITPPTNPPVMPYKPAN